MKKNTGVGFCLPYARKFHHWHREYFKIYPASGVHPFFLEAGSKTPRFPLYWTKDPEEALKTYKPLDLRASARETVRTLVNLAESSGGPLITETILAEYSESDVKAYIDSLISARAEKMTPEERERELKKQKDRFRFIQEARRKKKQDEAGTSAAPPALTTIASQPPPAAVIPDQKKVPRVIVDLEHDAAFTEPPPAQSPLANAGVITNVLVAEAAAGASSGSVEETPFQRKRKRSPSPATASPAFHLLRTANNLEELRLIMENLTKEELKCELDYLHLWHGGMCETVQVLRDQVREAKRDAQEDRNRAAQAEGKVWQLETDLGKHKQIVEDQQDELTLLRGKLSQTEKKLHQAEKEAAAAKINHEAERSRLENSVKDKETALAQLKESSFKEKEELLVKLARAEEERQKELQKLQDEHLTEMMALAADTYKDLMHQVRILYPSVDLEGVHYLHMVDEGKVMKPGEGPDSWVEVTLPEPAHTSLATKTADAPIHLEMPSTETPGDAEDADMRQGEEQLESPKRPGEDQPENSVLQPLQQDTSPK